ncbi:MAG: NUDIX hydrolase [Chloroflexus sp.]|uniref:NUDIX hydrolase n=1 Tax=Chloroflexus sp. TaxID=1904827 RepID=UPI0021DCBDCF|nr:NUDIX hydrolase [Chloroflexus sp.]GIV90648.1 MAG: NUDIX hydrolase [Chloroflexus sp.]GIV91277.1 MAG: NUDIX hydrolase [Chloroflexus sp.]
MNVHSALDWLPPHHRAEVMILTNQYGVPHHRHVVLTDGEFDPLIKTDRSGEVGMVVRRRDGGILVARKTYYPPGIFRLLTGGIAPNEPIAVALEREVTEETSLTVRIERFLGIITYEARQPLLRRFVSYVFWLTELGGTLHVADPTEQVAEMRTVTPPMLSALAETLRQLPSTTDPAINGRWASWGQFRAVMHEEVAGWLPA